MKMDRTTFFLVICVVAILFALYLENAKKAAITNVYVYMPGTLGGTQITATIDGHGNVIGGMNTVRNMIDVSPSLN